MPNPLLVQNDQLIQLSGVQNALTGAYINNAAVACTLKNKADESVVSGQTFPLTMTYVPASNGVYEAILEDGLALVNKQKYIVEISVDAGSDNIAFWHYILAAKWREPGD